MAAWIACKEKSKNDQDKQESQTTAAEINEGWTASLVSSASFDTQSSFFFFIAMEVK